MARKSKLKSQLKNHNTEMKEKPSMADKVKAKLKGGNPDAAAKKKLEEELKKRDQKEAEAKAKAEADAKAKKEAEAKYKELHELPIWLM